MHPAPVKGPLGLASRVKLSVVVDECLDLPTQDQGTLTSSAWPINTFETEDHTS